ncbi:hypothetical protein BC937DRAFT_93289 [Endogone sp. FLAS-F59071]|nr:hypothetical protein BC937DRAFT_93289 [Endogone sp. FLAS-F59071]|eukprot:RUS14811.1 hypothetical protein BC937DRAFT_93289 [Endogone sp. FLAS-F59071]
MTGAAGRRADLGEADLGKVDLGKADLEEADLGNIDLRGRGRRVKQGGFAERISMGRVGETGKRLGRKEIDGYHDCFRDRVRRGSARRLRPVVAGLAGSIDNRLIHSTNETRRKHSPPLPQQAAAAAAMGWVTAAGYSAQIPG